MSGLLLAALTAPVAQASTLLIAENGGHGESPPPMGDLIMVDTQTRAKSVLAEDLQDPVWTAVHGGKAYVGLFHQGSVVEVDLASGAKRTVATDLSCPEGIGLDDDGFLYAVENPIGNECAQPVRKPAAQLTKIDMTSGAQTKLADLQAPHGMQVVGSTAYICENGAKQVTQVDLATGRKTRVASMEDNSGCAVGDGYVYGIEEGSNGSLVKIDLASGQSTTLIEQLKSPMGVAVDVAEGFVYAGERGANRVRRVSVNGGDSEVFVDSLNSNIGMTVIASKAVHV